MIESEMDEAAMRDEMSGGLTTKTVNTDRFILRIQVNRIFDHREPLKIERRVSYQLNERPSFDHQQRREVNSLYIQTPRHAREG